MSFPDKPYKALQNLLGEEFVSRDPAQTMAYSRPLVNERPATGVVELVDNPAAFAVRGEGSAASQ